MGGGVFILLYLISPHLDEELVLGKAVDGGNEKILNIQLLS